MAKKADHKAQKVKARQEALRKQKAAATAQPRLLRQNPDLAAALSLRHPLIGYFVTSNWVEARFASIHVIRQAPDGEVAAGFLVDLLGRGVKDAYGRWGETDILGQLRDRLSDRHAEVTLVPIAVELGVNIIRGGVEWARRWHFPLPEDYDIWLRLVDPVPAWGLDLGLFGEDGHPVIVATAGEAGAPAAPEPDSPLWTLEEELAALAAGFDEPIPAVAPAEGPGGLWLPPGARPGADPPVTPYLYLPDGTRRDLEPAGE